MVSVVSVLSTRTANGLRIRVSYYGRVLVLVLIIYAYKLFARQISTGDISRKVYMVIALALKYIIRSGIC